MSWNPFRLWWQGCRMIASAAWWLARKVNHILSLPETTDVLVIVCFLMMLAMVSFVLS